MQHRVLRHVHVSAKTRTTAFLAPVTVERAPVRPCGFKNPAHTAANCHIPKASRNPECVCSYRDEAHFKLGMLTQSRKALDVSGGLHHIRAAPWGLDILYVNLE